MPGQTKDEPSLKAETPGGILQLHYRKFEQRYRLGYYVTDENRKLDWIYEL